MEALIFLATVMALFGVLGYLRGPKSSLFTAVIIWLGLVLISRFSGLIAMSVNGMNYAVNFVLAGGLAALGGDGDRGAALEAVFGRMTNVKPLVNPDGSGIGMVVIFLLLVTAGFLLGTLKIFKSKVTLWGLLVGLTNGYVLSAFLLPRLLPGAGIRLPLPGGLAGTGSAAAGGAAAGGAAAATPAGQTLSAALIDRIIEILNSLVAGGQIAAVIAILIVIFVLLATRRSGRKK